MGPTFSIIVGGTACNARCPFCVSRMTGTMKEEGEEYTVLNRLENGGVEVEGYGVCTDPNLKGADRVNWRNFHIAARFARELGSQTAMLTGKGEPTLWPSLIMKYVEHLRAHNFPFIEIQTNGLSIARGQEKDAMLHHWYEAGVTTVAISIAHYLPARNKQIYLANKGEYPSLPDLIKKLHGFGFSVRLCVVAINGYVDTPFEVGRMIKFASDNGVEQLTITPINAPTASDDPAALEWTKDHMLSDSQVTTMRNNLDMVGTRHQILPHGAIVYDVRGQNVCLNNCLSQKPNDGSQLRNVIFHPDGHIRHRWDLKGAIIL